MEHHQHVPWQLKIAAKIILSRVPLSPRLLNKAGVFRTNAMQDPGYAVGVFAGSPPQLENSKVGARPVHGRSAGT